MAEIEHHALAVIDGAQLPGQPLSDDQLAPLREVYRCEPAPWRPAALDKALAELLERECGLEMDIHWVGLFPEGEPSYRVPEKITVKRCTNPRGVASAVQATSAPASRRLIDGMVVAMVDGMRGVQDGASRDALRALFEAELVKHPADVAMAAAEYIVSHDEWRPDLPRLKAVLARYGALRARLAALLAGGRLGRVEAPQRPRDAEREPLEDRRAFAREVDAWLKEFLPPPERRPFEPRAMSEAEAEALQRARNKSLGWT